MASISFRNVTKIYDGADKPVVPNLNLEIADRNSSSWSGLPGAASPPPCV